MCGDCCRINMLSMTEDELVRIREHVRAEGLEPIDYQGERCCFQKADGSCMIWSVRAQICQLYHCRVPRNRILLDHPEVRVQEDTRLVNMHEEFIGEMADWDAFAMPLLDAPLSLD